MKNILKKGFSLAALLAFSITNLSASASNFETRAPGFVNQNASSGDIVIEKADYFVDRSEAYDFEDNNIEIIDESKLENSKVNVDDSLMVSRLPTSQTKLASLANTGSSIGLENCSFEEPQEYQYSTDLVSVRKKYRVDLGEEYRVKVFVKNTSNVPWFSVNSSCDVENKVSLGTYKEKDRDSRMYSEIDKDDNNWKAPNRVAMDQLRVEPGHIASFTFWTKAGEENDLFREYFAPVVEGITWMDDSSFYFDTVEGEIKESKSRINERVLLLGDTSHSLMQVDLDAEKRLVVSTAQQKMQVKLGDHVVREFRVSTGAARTPTPHGVTKITEKNYVRVGYSPPHYIMPRFMMFRYGGYGFHALPSLANDNGVFWSEALSHIGVPVSHGCIRLLPADADWLFEFTDIGTTVEVKSYL